MIERGTKLESMTKVTDPQTPGDIDDFHNVCTHILLLDALFDETLFLKIKPLCK